MEFTKAKLVTKQRIFRESICVTIIIQVGVALALAGSWLDADICSKSRDAIHNCCAPGSCSEQYK